MTVPCHFLFQAISKIQVLVVGEVPVRHNMSKPPEDSRAVREKLAKGSVEAVVNVRNAGISNNAAVRLTAFALHNCSVPFV